MSANSVIRCSGPPGRIANRTCPPRAVALRWALSRCRMAERSRHAVEVRSAMTTVTPGVKAALICSAACSAVAASIWAGRVTMTGGAQVSWPGMSVPLLPAGRGAARRAARPGEGRCQPRWQGRPGVSALEDLMAPLSIKRKGGMRAGQSRRLWFWVQEPVFPAAGPMQTRPRSAAAPKGHRGHMRSQLAR